MTVELSIKGLPDTVAKKLRQRAARHHRSLQREIVAILEGSVAEERTLTPAELLAEVRAKGLATPSESAAFVREDRDERSRR